MSVKYHQKKWIVMNINVFENLLGIKFLHDFQNVCTQFFIKSSSFWKKKIFKFRVEVKMSIND